MLRIELKKRKDLKIDVVFCIFMYKMSADRI